MVQVTSYDREPLERTLRRFKKKVEKAGIIQDVKKNAFYVKPSVDKRMRQSKSMKRTRRISMMQGI